MLLDQWPFPVSFGKHDPAMVIVLMGTVIVVMMLLSSQLCGLGNPELFFSSLGVKKSGAPEHCIATSRTGQS